MDDPSEFEAERDHLTAVAYRMLGSRAEAEDAVQETWLRYAAALDQPEARARIRDLRGWLTTTVGRICLDVLRSARVRREAYPGQWLPEPVVTRLPRGVPDQERSGFAPDPAERAVTSEQVGLAMLVMLERLTPEQRVALVLHDVFAMPFAEIAGVLGTTEVAARQHASRARRAVTGNAAPRHTAQPTEQRRAVAAFLAAAQSGDLDRLVAVLAPDAAFLSDGGGYVSSARRPIAGSLQVARFTLGLFRRQSRDTTTLRSRLVLVNGTLGVQIEGTLAGGQPVRCVLSFAVDETARITGIFLQLNPAKLGRVPALPPDEGDWPPRL